MMQILAVVMALFSAGALDGEAGMMQENTSSSVASAETEAVVVAKQAEAGEKVEVAVTTPAVGFIFKTIEFEGRSYPYTVYVPPEYTAEKAWPLILFLHGSGERGSDGLVQTEVGIARAIRRDRRLCPAIVVMPQAPANGWWAGKMLEMAVGCLEETSKEYRCDPERLYLTGLSMGGGGTWALAATMPNAFAAIVPVCGFVGDFRAGPDEDAIKKVAEIVAPLPIWCFHGAKDPAVPVEQSRLMVKAVEAAGGTIKYTEYPEGTHNVWDNAYSNPQLWKWMLSKKRAPAADDESSK